MIQASVLTSQFTRPLIVANVPTAPAPTIAAAVPSSRPASEGMLSDMGIELGELLTSFKPCSSLINATMRFSCDDPIGQSQSVHSAARKALHSGKPPPE